MALYFPEESEQLIPGTHGVIRRGTFEPVLERTRFIGLTGESEVGGAGSFAGREITFEHWLFGRWTEIGPLGTALDFLERLIGTHGTLLAITPGVMFQRLENCTFDGFMMRGDTGLFFSPTLGFMTIGEMRFRQLAPNTAEEES